MKTAGAILLLCTTLALSAKANIEPKGFFKKTFAEDDNKTSKKSKASKSLATVKIVPAIIKKALHVTIKGDMAKQFDFFVFDAEGKMILNYKVHGGDRVTVSNLSRGLYNYHVFCNDESVATGKMEFR